MKTIEPIRFNETDYSVDGLFVKGISRIKQTRLKTPILMVHGACHGWWAYHKWLTFYAAAGWKAYSMSLRNHTDSYSIPEERYLSRELLPIVFSQRQSIKTAKYWQYSSINKIGDYVWESNRISNGLNCVFRA